MLYLFQPVVLICSVSVGPPAECNWGNSLMALEVGDKLSVNDASLRDGLVEQCQASAREFVLKRTFDKSGKVFAVSACNEYSKKSEK